MPRVAVNGINLAYEEWGEGTPLVFAHEFAGSIEAWKPQAKQLARRYRVIAYNARGYPPSDVPADPAAYSLPQVVDDLRGLLTALGIDKAHIGGLSMGGGLSVAFALTHPRMCRSIIVCSAGSGSTNADEFRPQQRAMSERLEREGLATAPTTPGAHHACSSRTRTRSAPRRSSTNGSRTRTSAWR